MAVGGALQEPDQKQLAFSEFRIGLNITIQ
jgi:hypothetical protein